MLDPLRQTESQPRTAPNLNTLAGTHRLAIPLEKFAVDKDRGWETPLASLLGVVAEEVRRSLSYIGGASRKGDKRILTQIIHRLSTAATVDCLEVGCGVTWGVDANYGSPCLSRVLARDSRVNITATDKLSSTLLNRYGRENRIEFIDFYRSPEGALHTEKISINFSNSKEQRLLLKNLTAHISQPLIPGRAMRPLVGVNIGHLLPNDTIEYICDILDYDPVSQGVHYIRPFIDPDMERFLFGLKVAGSVDFTEPKNSFDGQTFDLIFARNIESSYEIRRCQILNALSPLLKPKGEIIIDGDWG